MLIRLIIVVAFLFALLPFAARIARRNPYDGPLALGLKAGILALVVGPLACLFFGGIVLLWFRGCH